MKAEFGKEIPVSGSTVVSSGVFLDSDRDDSRGAASNRASRSGRKRVADSTAEKAQMAPNDLYGMDVCVHNRFVEYSLAVLLKDAVNSVRLSIVISITCNAGTRCKEK